VTKPRAWLTSITFSSGQIVKIEPGQKILLVGPNNSGKSQALREIFYYSSLDENENNIVICDLNFNKSGNSDDFINFIKKNGKIKDNMYFYKDFRCSIVSTSMFNSHPRLGGLRDFFIKNISAEARLRITEMQKSISPEDHKSAPQHVLYDNDTLMKRISDLFRDAFGEDLFFDYRGGESLPIHVGSPPMPASDEDRVSDSFVEKVRQHPLLHEQGDGMKSYAGILFEAVATERDITLIDEPEAFLHPPHMRRLGATLATEVEGQLLVATHSSDILHGFLTGKNGSARILRMQRDGSVNRVTEAPVDAITTLWKQPDLRYSNALEGIFHEQTIVCEGHSDCRLYNAMADHLESGEENSWPDTAYVPAGGKAGIHKIASVLRKIGVPVKGVYDIDLLSDKKSVQDAVESFGGDWDEVWPVWNRFNIAVTNDVTPRTSEEIKNQIIDVVQKAKRGSLPRRRDIDDLFKNGKPWDVVKKYGVGGIPSGKAQADYRELAAALQAMGIVVVHVGEIENFCRDIQEHGPKFVTKLLQDMDLGDSRLKELRIFVKNLLA